MMLVIVFKQFFILSHTQIHHSALTGCTATIGFTIYVSCEITVHNKQSEFTQLGKYFGSKIEQHGFCKNSEYN